MNLVILSLIMMLCVSVLLICKLIDILHKIDAQVEEDGDHWGWTNEELMKENEALRKQLDDLRRQNDFLIGRL